MGDRTNDELLRRRESAEKAIDSGVVTLADGYIGYGCEMKFGLSFDGGEETEVVWGKSCLGFQFIKAHIGRKGDKGNFLEQNHPEDVIADIDEVLRLREESDQLRAQIEGLKECVGVHVFTAMNPGADIGVARTKGKAQIDAIGVDAFLSVWKAACEDESNLPELKKMIMQFKD